MNGGVGRIKRDHCMSPETRFHAMSEQRLKKPTLADLIRESTIPSYTIGLKVHTDI